MADTNQALSDQLARLQRDLDRLARGVGLLGIKPCSWCGTFVQTSDPGALFGSANPVCYGCLPQWWPEHCASLSVKDREIVERDLKTWLVNYHHAEVIKAPEKVPKNPAPRLQLVVSCFECHASGDLAGTRCRFCDGRGTVWIVIPG